MAELLNQKSLAKKSKITRDNYLQFNDSTPRTKCFNCREVTVGNRIVRKTSTQVKCDYNELQSEWEKFEREAEDNLDAGYDMRA